MRIALGRLGGRGVASKQLIIDEGFVACDDENLVKVHPFLRSMLHRYSSILLISHVGEIKDCADVAVAVRRSSDGTSSLVRFGAPVGPVVLSKANESELEKVSDTDPDADGVAMDASRKEKKKK